MAYLQYDPLVLKEIQRTELEILAEFVRICNKYSLDYFLNYGTLLGAIRHKGFIPWDDDVDVCMPRKDYEQFLKISEKEFNGKFKLSGPDVKNHYYNLILNISKVGTRFCTSYDHGNYHIGIFIEIYPYDSLAENLKERKRQIRRTAFFQQLYLVYNVNFLKNSVSKTAKNFFPRLASYIVHILLHFFHVHEDWIIRKHHEASTAYNGKSSILAQFVAGVVEEGSLQFNDLYPLREVSFENIMVKIPNQYDKLLRSLYGDYMQLPPEDQRQNHYPYLLEFHDGIDS